MRRTLLLIALMPLVACSPDEQAAENAKAAEAFDAAFAQIEIVGKGYIPDSASLTLSLEEYQQEKLAEASQMLEPILRQGTADQRVAASVALASVEAAQGRRLAQQAAKDKATQAVLSKEMLSTLTGVKKSQTIYDAHQAIDRDPALRAANAELTVQQEQLRAAEAVVRAKQADIDRRTATRRQLDAQRATKAKEASDLSARGFSSSGQLRFDLLEQAKAVSREADQLGAASDAEALAIDRANAELAVANMEKQQAEEGIAHLQSIIKAFEDRQRNLGVPLDKASQDATQLADTLVELIKKRAEEQTRLVADRYTKARSHFEKAVSTLEGAQEPARRSVSPDTRSQLAVSLGSAQTQMALIMQQEAQAHQSFAELLNMVAAQTETGFPKPQAATIRTMAEDAVTRAAHSAAEAAEALKRAGELLRDAEQQVQDTNRRVVLQQQLDVYNTLATTTGSDDARQRADGVRATLNEMQN